LWQAGQQLQVPIPFPSFRAIHDAIERWIKPAARFSQTASMPSLYRYEEASRTAGQARHSDGDAQLSIPHHLRLKTKPSPIFGQSLTPFTLKMKMASSRK